MWAMLLVFFVAMLGGSLSAVILAPKLRSAGIVGKDLHKPSQPEIPEMGGLALIVGFTLAIVFAIGLEAFLPQILHVDFVLLLAVLATVLLTGLVGILDDLLGLRQAVKAFLPVIAALPLVAVRAGHTVITIPFLGRVDFGLAYSLVLVPLGITGAANAVNMLAGFNGLELGMSLVAMGALSAIAAKLGATTALIILLAGSGAALGLLLFNWYPAKIFVGDVGTLSLGAILASSCIVGNFEAAGLLIIVPYSLDFLIKATHGFPSRGWAGELGQDGKLYCPKDGPVGLAQAILKIHPLSERSLVLVLMSMEAIFAGLALFFYYFRR